MGHRKRKIEKESQTYRFRHQTSHHPQRHGPNPNLESEDSPTNSLGHKNMLPVGGQTTWTIECGALLTVLSLISLFKDNLFIVRRRVGPEDVVVHARFL